MRCLMSIAAFALFLSVPAWAQRGGGHGGGHAGGAGHVGGFSGHAGGHFGGGGHVGGGGHFSGVPSRRGFARGAFHGSRGPFLHGGTHVRIRTRGFRNHCHGYGCWGRFGYPWWYAGYYDPWWWNDNSSYDEDHYRDLAAANEMNQQSLEEQRLRRQEEADGDQDAYMLRSSNAPTGAGADPGNPATPPTVLVFRDGRKQEIQNYAIVGQTLWDFAPRHTEKISLAALDLNATAKVNDDRGVSFHLPVANEAQ